MHLEEENLPCGILQRDRDTKYVDQFDEVFRSTGCEIKKTCPRSPNLQAFVERVVQTLKHEVLNAFCVVSESHLDHILRVSQDWYNLASDYAFVLEVGKIEILLLGTWYRAPSATTHASAFADQAGVLGRQVGHLEYPGAIGQRMAA